ncbi:MULTISPECIES: hypothetical protein [Calothrix]|uniref:7-cyano-7-deazaguanine synthase n=2 Tax=Calothrix TaxID=1186 RepID=A0ABR8AFN6_9CYAN|nr:MULTISPECIES: hypothetical protein [Calothrix]MBD2197362.1 hypothetical protein [Calothrix parietina FACHB-288]MBD2228180.1 hypothetical protein [Calothrix anomala FACHB-343]
MKIINLKSEQKDNLFQVGATVIWENRDRAPQEVYIATTKEFAQDLSCNPHSFLIACTIVAFYYGEKRVFIDAEICPQLLENLQTAMAMLKVWYKRSDRSIIPIEAKIKTTVPTPTTPKQASIFFTGGIDTLATLRLNRINYPLEHPRSIKDGLFIYGFSNTTLENYEKAYKSFDEIKKDAGITLIPVYTNLYAFVKDLDVEQFGIEFWKDYYTSAALSAVAHAFSSRLASISVSSSDEIAYLQPWGTHPLLDTLYSSYDFTIRHEYIALSRFTKTKLVAEWDLALQKLRVCDQLSLPPGYLNCGECPKCVATMAQLAALGMLEKATTFPANDISAEMILQKSNIQHFDEEAYYLDLVELFEQQNRTDLVISIQRLSRRFRSKELIKNIDKKILGGAIYHAYSKIPKPKSVKKNRTLDKITQTKLA